VALVPFMGFPNLFRKIIFVFLGLIIAFLAYLIHKDHKLAQPRKNKISTYTENRDEIF
jgi:hypothetical protein